MLACRKGASHKRVLAVICGEVCASKAQFPPISSVSNIYTSTHYTCYTFLSTCSKEA